MKNVTITEMEIPSGDQDLPKEENSGEDGTEGNVLSESDLAELEEMEANLSEAEIFSDSDVFNILLLGTDERRDNYSTNARADSIMVLSMNKKDKCLRLVSLERGMGVPILEGAYKGQYDWLTDAFGGVDINLTDMEVQGLNGEVRTNARTKTRVVPGKNQLDGYDALQYARLRYIDSDWKRIERQRNVIQSVVHAAKGMTFLELNEAVDVVLPLIQTNLTMTEIMDLVLFAPNVLGNDIEQMSIPKQGIYGSMKSMGGRSLYAVDFAANAEILKAFFVWN